jgi:hypothetical protein
MMGESTMIDEAIIVKFNPLYYIVFVLIALMLGWLILGLLSP